MKLQIKFKYHLYILNFFQTCFNVFSGIKLALWPTSAVGTQFLREYLREVIYVPLPGHLGILRISDYEVPTGKYWKQQAQHTWILFYVFANTRHEVMPPE